MENKTVMKIENKTAVNGPLTSTAKSAMMMNEANRDKAPVASDKAKNYKSMMKGQHDVAFEKCLRKGCVDIAAARACLMT